MTHNEMIAVIEAHRDGKRIQIKFGDQLGKDCERPDWSFDTFEYRIAVEPRRCWVRWDKDGEFRYTKDSLLVIDDAGWQLVIEEVK